MKKYIDKAAVVAEIEKLYNLEYDNTSDLSCGKKIILRNILLFLDTLETKEVDLEREIDRWICDAAITHEDCSIDDVIRTAKHFFELGINTRKGE